MTAPSAKRNTPSAAEMRSLELLWLNSEHHTLGDFAKEHKLDPQRFRAKAKGWAARKRALRSLTGGQAPKSETARALLLGLWWEIVNRLGLCFGDDEHAVAELKRLSAIASILKVTHAGVAQLLPLDTDGEMTPLAIEGFDARHL